jgi:hypothetical protein
MNTLLWWAVPLALIALLVLVPVGWAMLRRRPHPGQRTAAAPRAKPQAPQSPQSPLPAAPAGGVAAQHQAAIEALRQARRRKADDETRQAAERAAPRPVVAPAATPLAATAALPTAAPAAASGTAAPPAAGRVLPPVAGRPEPVVPVVPVVPVGRVGRVVPVLSPLAIQLNAGRGPLVWPATAPAGLAPLRTPPRPTWRPTVLVADVSKVVRV